MVFGEFMEQSPMKLCCSTAHLLPTHRFRNSLINRLKSETTDHSNRGEGEALRRQLAQDEDENVDKVLNVGNQTGTAA